MTNPNSETLLLTAALIAGLLILAFVLLESILLFQRFSKDLSRINREIHRSTSGERPYWLRKRRRLWLSLIPFVPYKCY